MVLIRAYGCSARVIDRAWGIVAPARERIDAMLKRPTTRRPHAANLGVGAVLILGLLVACDSTASSSSSTTTEHLGASVALTNDGCTHSGPASLSAEGGQLTIPVANDSDFVAVVSLLQVGSAFDSVAAEVDDYNDAESVGEPFELTANPDVTQAAEVQVDPSGEGELSADVVSDTYAILCLGTAADGGSEGLDEAFLFGPIDVTE
jgi:hypothetical protein